MRSSSPYDVIVVGAGHNGLTAAAYLARAGKSVLVLESRPNIGGTTATETLAPRFRVSACFGSAELLHPTVVRDLGLEARGLKLLPTRGGTYLPQMDGEHLYVSGQNGAAGEIARHSRADARAFEAFDAFLGRVTRALEPVQTRSLPALKPGGPGDVRDLLGIGWRLRRLGKQELPEALRFLPMCVQDVLDERFETEALKAAIAVPGLTASYLGPKSAGSAFGLLHHRPGWCPGIFTPPVFVEGGSGSLCDALAEAAQDSGAEIRTEARVERILVDEEGAQGVMLESGETLNARAVVSAVDPKRTLLELSDPTRLEPEIVAAIRSVRSRGSVGIVRLAVGELPRFTNAPAGDSHLLGRILIAPSLSYLERAFDSAKYGRVPKDPYLEVTIPSLSDPTLAPAGRHVLLIWAQFVPDQLADGTWKRHREELGEQVMSTLERYAPGFSSAVLHRQVLTPTDLEERYGLTQGCLYHVEPALDQFLYMRPWPGWYRYATPVRKLYLCGPGTHPGGGVTGLPGRNAARQLVKDWRRAGIG